MKIILLLLLIGVQKVYGQSNEELVVTDDITNFWSAYTAITLTKDSAEQYKLLREKYIDKGSPGLHALIKARGYTEKEYITIINNFPKFWTSIKPNTLSIHKLVPEIKKNIQQLRTAYPTLGSSTIYFSVGAFRTNGSAQGNMVLIGSELALGDTSTFIDELPLGQQSFYREYRPLDNLALLCTHEYIHTQQRALVQNLLSISIYEGVAEFLSCLVTGKRSGIPAIAFGKANRDKVIRQYIKDLFTMRNNNNWLWGENANELKVRDLGYYVGYEICERFYHSMKDKQQAVRDLIELDYTNEKKVEALVDRTNLFPKTLKKLHKEYEDSRPTVVTVQPFKNKSKHVMPGVTQITVNFSKPLNAYNTGIDFGPLGEGSMPKISTIRTWSADGRSWTFTADLQPGKHYQILISNNFRTKEGVSLKPYLIDIRTRK